MSHAIALLAISFNKHARADEALSLQDLDWQAKSSFLELELYPMYRQIMPYNASILLGSSRQ